MFKVGDKVRCTNLDGYLENDGLIKGIGDVYTVVGYCNFDFDYPVVVNDEDGNEWYYAENELELEENS